MQLTADTPSTTNTSPRTVPATVKPGGAYETNYNALMADQSREVYAETYKLIQDLSLLKIQGIIEVTVRTRTGSLSIPITAQQVGADITLDLITMLGEKMDQLERDILKYTQDSEENEPFDKYGESDRAALFAFCLPMRPLSDAEFNAMPPEARRAFDETRAERVQAA